MKTEEVSEVFYGQRIWYPGMIIEKIRSRLQGFRGQAGGVKSTNTEEISWTDWQGKNRVMKVKREIT